jgi:hypothetical protein
MTIILRYPRYYRARNRGYLPAGNGLKKRHIITFTPTGPRMTKLPPPLQLKPSLKLNHPIPSPGGGSAGGKVIKLKLKSPHLQRGERTPTTNAASFGSNVPGSSDRDIAREEAKPRLKLKLKLPGGGNGP